MATWGAFERAAPVLARLGRERLERRGLAFIGTLRKDGGPRLSPVEILFVDEHLYVGMMPRSMKARDLLRDARCALHSVTVDPNGERAILSFTVVRFPLRTRRCAPVFMMRCSRPPAGGRRTKRATSPSISSRRRSSSSAQGRASSPGRRSAIVASGCGSSQGTPGTPGPRASSSCGARPRVPRSGGYGAVARGGPGMGRGVTA